MILQKAWQLWEDEHPRAAAGAGPNAPAVDDAIPQVDPQWDPNNQASLAHLHGYCAYLIRETKSASPRTNSTAKAMSLEEEKCESPSHWLERIREALQKHGGMDPERPAFDTLLKVQLVTEAWPDIRKEVQKDEEWKNKRLEPRRDFQLSSFKLMFGIPYPSNSQPSGGLEISDEYLKQYVAWILPFVKSLQQEAQLAQTLPLNLAFHNIQPGDLFLVKEWKDAPLVAKWHGSFQVLLTT